jgi:polar amino acid transport system substrate-binding protein
MDKRSFLKGLGTAAVAAPVAAVTAKVSAPNAVASKQSVYQRVMGRGVLRAGSFEEPPFTMIDPNTGERSGIVVEVTKRFAEEYGLKIEWQTIANFAMMGEDLDVGRYDAICASLINMPRGGRIDYTIPFVFIPTFGYVRADETRFTSLKQLNNPAYTIAGQEGAAVTAVAKDKYPDAKSHVLTNADLADMLVSVVTKKADVAFMIPSFYDEFNKNSPGKLKPLDDKDPLQVFSFSFGLKPEEEGFKSILNGTLHRMIVSGELDELFKQFDPGHGLLRPTIHYSNAPYK